MGCFGVLGVWVFGGFGVFWGFGVFGVFGGFGCLGVTVKGLRG